MPDQASPLPPELPVPEEATVPPRHPGAQRGRLWLLQSGLCLLVVLLALLLRFVGGSVFTQLQQAFHRAITDNSLLSSIGEAVSLTEPTTQATGTTVPVTAGETAGG